MQQYDRHNSASIEFGKRSSCTLESLETLHTDLEDKLLKFGLRNAEVKVLLFLTKHGPTKASDLAKGTGIPRTQMYDVLNSLQNKGLLVASITRPAKYSSVPLDKAIDFLIQVQRQNLYSMEKTKESLTNVWSKIQESEVIKSSDLTMQTDKIQIVAGFARIFSIARNIISSAEREILIVANERNVARLFHAGITDDLQAIASKGINVQILTSSSSEELLNELGACSIKKIREGLNPETFFIAVDSRQLLFISKNEMKYAKDTFAIWTNSALLVGALTLSLGEGDE